jgi:hypothetical protein
LDELFILLRKTNIDENGKEIDENIIDYANDVPIVYTKFFGVYNSENTDENNNENTLNQSSFYKTNAYVSFRIFLLRALALTLSRSFSSLLAALLSLHSNARVKAVRENRIYEKQCRMFAVLFFVLSI